MTDLPIILAEGIEDVIKFIFIAIFVLVWIVGGLLSSLKKKPTSRAPEKSWDEIFRELSGEPQRQPPPPPPPIRAQPVPTRPEQMRRPVPVQRPVGTGGGTASAPPSGPAVRKKLRRRQRGERLLEAAAPPPPPPGAGALSEPIIERPVISTLPGDIATSEIGGGKAAGRRTAGAGATEVRNLLRPGTLRHQFILTELLQPPKALRDDRSPLI